MTALIAISLITTNKQRIDENHVQDFVELIEQERFVPSITVRVLDGGFILIDGRHRLAAHKVKGLTTIRANVEGLK